METRNGKIDDSGIQAEKLQDNTSGCELGELIYTSAPRVLKSQAGHLGIVAETRDFPSEVERQLSRFWSYSLPQELKIPETEAVPRFVLYPVGGASQAISLTRVQSAGFDHTGRTNPIAHHFVAELRDLQANGLGIADMVTWAAHGENSGTQVFRNRWNGEPVYLEKQRLPRIDFGTSPFTLIDAISNNCGPSREVLEEAVLATADVLRGYHMNQRMVVVVVKPTYAASVLQFIGAVLCALPRRKQSDVTAISHVWEINDAPSGYSLAFTYPRSPYLERIQQRIDSKKPVVIDLAMKVPEVPQAESAYVTFVKNDRDRWNSKVNLPIPRLFDQVDPAYELESVSYAFKSALIDWDANNSHESLAALCSSRRSCISLGLRTIAVDRLVRQAGTTTITHLVVIGNWQMLFAVYRDTQLPNELRLVARDAIDQHISVIAEIDPDLVAQATLESDGVHWTKLLATREEIKIEPILSAANAGASSLPDTKSRTGAANWAVLGTKVIRRAWNCLSTALSAGQTPSPFYRRILDRLIPLAMVKTSNHESAMSETAGQSNDQPGLETVLAPAWRIVSRQIQAGSSPHVLCQQIVEELVGSADVASSTESLARLAAVERQHAPEERCERDS